jgi:hypothetical protein
LSESGKYAVIRWPRHFTNRLLLATGLLTLLTVTATVTAQSIPVSPQVFGLTLGEGAVRPGNGERVLVRDATEDLAVAQVHARVGEQLIVMLPDGQLSVRQPNECTPTLRPFEPLGTEALLQQLKSTGFADWRHRQTRHYLFLYNSGELYVEVTSRVLETMYRGIELYAGAQKIEVRPPTTPLVVIVFATREQFRAYRTMPEDVVAFYDVVTNRVVMCEESSLSRVKPQLAIRQAIATIAHEGAHQILHNIGVQQRLSVWPMWLNEGLAEFFAPTTTDLQMKWKGAGEVNDLRMFELEQLIKSRSVDAVDGQMVAQTVGAARLTSTGYATAWALTHYLAKNHREAWHGYVRELCKRGPLVGGGEVVPPGVIPSNLRDFKEHFGADLADLERRLILHLRRLPYQDPFADWPHWVAYLTTGNGGPASRQADVFHQIELAERWLRERSQDSGGERLPESAFGIREFANRILAERFARQWLQMQ